MFRPHQSVAVFRPSDRLSRCFPACLVLVVSAILAARLFRLVHHYAVNVLYYDQWDFYSPLFAQSDWLTLFRWQHGPHRQGCGLFVTWLVAQLSGWNTRAECFTIVALLVAALALGLVLKWQIHRRWDWTDLVIPLLFLTPVQYEQFAGAPNPSHGPLPLLLLMVYGLVWYCGSRPKCYALVLLLNLLLVYTGFGLFIALITPVLLGICCYRDYRAGDVRGAVWSASALAIALLTGLSFFVGYRFQPASQEFRAWHTRWWEYPYFVTKMLGYFLGSRRPLGTCLGCVALCGMVAGCVYHGRKLITGESRISLVIFAFTAFSLLFCFNTAYGRVGIGISTACTSRYTTYLIPGFLALYLHGLTLQRPVPRRILLLAVLLLAFNGGWCVHRGDAQIMNQFAQGKREWKTAFLATGSVERAEKLAHFKIYPDPDATSLAQKILYLKTRHLNLFRNRD